MSEKRAKAQRRAAAAAARRALAAIAAASATVPVALSGAAALPGVQDHAHHGQGVALAQVYGSLAPAGAPEVPHNDPPGGGAAADPFIPRVITGGTISTTHWSGLQPSGGFTAYPL